MVFPTFCSKLWNIFEKQFLLTSFITTREDTPQPFLGIKMATQETLKKFKNCKKSFDINSIKWGWLKSWIEEKDLNLQPISQLLHLNAISHSGFWLKRKTKEGQNSIIILNLKIYLIIIFYNYVAPFLTLIISRS